MKLAVEKRLGSVFLRRVAVPCSLLLALVSTSSGCHSQNQLVATAQASSRSGPTNISVGTHVLRSGVKRLGINLSGQSFYDSGEMLRNLTYRNPGFEGEIWQTILQCKFIKDNSCADNDEWSGWPADFAKGASFEFFSGAASGQTGIVSSNSVAASAVHQGVWINFGKLAIPPQLGDFYILRMKKPGDAEAGWWPRTDNGATITSEFKDISPASPGKQALRMTAFIPTQSASVTANVDTWIGRSFLQLNGTYTLNFRAKGTGGTNQLNISIVRLDEKHGNTTYLTRTLSLTSAWKDFQFSFNAKEDGTYIGPIQVSFTVSGASALLDDVSLMEAASPDNPTAFRNAVVTRLRELRPGVLRYMDNGSNFGSTIDNLLVPTFARERAGFSEGNKIQEDIAFGLHDFLVLCQAIHADPWFVIPAGATPAEASHLVEYLGGSATSAYGAKRVALGQSAPWTSVFSNIHLELGNETWNAGSFAGEGIPEPLVYSGRVATIFGTIKASPLYDAAKFDLIMNGWNAVPWWNEKELSVKTNADTIDIAPYTFSSFNDASSTEAIFGPMFAEPEALDSRPEGVVAAQAKVAAKAGVKLAVYEVNLGTMEGKASQQELESTVPSLGAGLSVAEHMLLMLRDNGITNQAMFSLPEFTNGFTNSAHPEFHESVKLWGTVIDMGGQTNRVRPAFAAEALVNEAIADKMIETTHSGSDPTWDQPESANSKIKLNGAHLIQSFAFTDGTHCSLVVFNLSRTMSLPVTFSGPAAPQGSVRLSRLTSANITDNNENTLTVAAKHQTLEKFTPLAVYALPPFSMTVLRWEVSGVHF